MILLLKNLRIRIIEKILLYNKYIMKRFKCQYIFKIGKKKGLFCNKSCFASKCGRHNDNAIDVIKKYNNNNRELQLERSRNNYRKIKAKKVHNEINKQKLKNYKTNWYYVNKQKKNDENNKIEKEKNKIASLRYYHNNRDKILEKQRAYRLIKRNKYIEALKKIVFIKPVKIVKPKIIKIIKPVEIVEITENEETIQPKSWIEYGSDIKVEW
jgi:hypothetical protein